MPFRLRAKCDFLFAFLGVEGLLNMSTLTIKSLERRYFHLKLNYVENRGKHNRSRPRTNRVFVPLNVDLAHIWL